MTAAADTGPWLVADIGGTNARFGWLAHPGARLAEVRTLEVGTHPRLRDAVHAYLDDLGARLGTPARPRRAALAVATPITADLVAFTNSPWAFSQRELREALGVEVLRVINDFEAQARALPLLRPEQVRPIGDMAPRADGVLAVVGPGTGLGVGAIVHTAAGWQPLPGEGGHVTLAAADAFEAALIEAARGTWGHVSAERFLSGTGLPALHAAVRQVLGQAPATLTPAEIVQRGLDRSDDACDRVVDVFCAMLGGVAGNVALTLGARGGVYIGGGIVPRLGERFFTSRFRDRFEDKGRFRAYLRDVPTALVLDTLVALEGAAAALHD